jgi:hypothetical protein
MRNASGGWNGWNLLAGAWGETPPNGNFCYYTETISLGGLGHCEESCMGQSPILHWSVDAALVMFGFQSSNMLGLQFSPFSRSGGSQLHWTTFRSEL